MTLLSSICNSSHAWVRLALVAHTIYDQYSFRTQVVYTSVWAITIIKFSYVTRSPHDNIPQIWIHNIVSQINLTRLYIHRIVMTSTPLMISYWRYIASLNQLEDIGQLSTSMSIKITELSIYFNHPFNAIGVLKMIILSLLYDNCSIKKYRLLNCCSISLTLKFN